MSDWSGKPDDADEQEKGRREELNVRGVRKTGIGVRQRD